MSANIQHSKESVEHFSPKWLVEASRKVLERIDFDPASCALANETVRATEYGTLEGECPLNGLECSWGPAWPGQYDSGGGRLLQPSRVFHNPPTPAALWWAKACFELCRKNIEACIFVAFSVELFQTAQNASYKMHTRWHPLDFPTCIPSSRVKYDQRIEDRIAALRKRESKLTEADQEARVKLEARIVELEALRASGTLLVSGASPSHSSAIICMTHVPEIRERFVKEFAQYGVVTAGR